VGGAAAAVRALVTGGGGFLGAAVVRRLVARGDSVRSLTRGAYPELDALGVQTVRGDVADAAVVRAAAADCDVVFHIAAKAGIWGPSADYRRSNVDGARHVLDACRVQRVPRLVYTSTPSVVHAGRDIAGGDESLPYATRFSAPYPATKAAAERLVLAANSADLATVALRPHLVWGPGDTQLVPRILELRRRGRLRLVNGGRALVDSTYIDDAADAHLLAAEQLMAGSAVAGRAYFVSAGEPWPVRELINGFLAAGGLSPVTASLPLPVAYGLGAGLEAAYRLLAPAKEPPMTRFLARQLATAHWFDISAARRELGYTPQVSIADGLRRLRAHLAATRNG
jgi:nucleoside-diphosphate-sugar epimerase